MFIIESLVLRIRVRAVVKKMGIWGWKEYFVTPLGSLQLSCCIPEILGMVLRTPYVLSDTMLSVSRSLCLALPSLEYLSQNKNKHNYSVVLLKGNLFFS